jgi:hypothetical protein
LWQQGGNEFIGRTCRQKRSTDRRVPEEAGQSANHNQIFVSQALRNTNYENQFRDSTAVVSNSFLIPADSNHDFFHQIGPEVTQSNAGVNGGWSHWFVGQQIT